MKMLRPALVLLVMLTVVTGVLYPLLIAALGQEFFPRAANGSLVYRDGQPVGSTLIGQRFTDPRYFWSRPSATTPQPYNALGSRGSNLGPLNPALAQAVTVRIAALRAADPDSTMPVPVDLVSASASGLDPEISLAAAYYQARRIARLRGRGLEDIRGLIESHAQRRLLGFLGEPRVNVLALNLALDKPR